MFDSIVGATKKDTVEISDGSGKLEKKTEWCRNDFINLSLLLNKNKRTSHIMVNPKKFTRHNGWSKNKKNNKVVDYYMIQKSASHIMVDPKKWFRHIMVDPKLLYFDYESEKFEKKWKILGMLLLLDKAV